MGKREAPIVYSTRISRFTVVLKEQSWMEMISYLFFVFCLRWWLTNHAPKWHTQKRFICLMISCTVQWIHSLKLTVRPWKRPSQKETIVFQPSIFRCKLLVSRRVVFRSWIKFLGFASALAEPTSDTIGLLVIPNGQPKIYPVILRLLGF